eukprot:7324342-Pyramimonas_sp.AAC.1
MQPDDVRKCQRYNIRAMLANFLGSTMQLDPARKALLGALDPFVEKNATSSLDDEALDDEVKKCWLVVAGCDRPGEVPDEAEVVALEGVISFFQTFDTSAHLLGQFKSHTRLGGLIFDSALKRKDDARAQLSTAADLKERVGMMRTMVNEGVLNKGVGELLASAQAVQAAGQRREADWLQKDMRALSSGIERCWMKLSAEISELWIGVFGPKKSTDADV